MPSNRRRFLATLGASGFAGLAGCSLPSSQSDADDSPTTDPPDPVPVTSVDDSEYDLSVSHDAADWDGYDPSWTAPTDPPNVDVATETLAEGLAIPWDLSFVSDEELFVSERTGRIRRYESGNVSTVVAPDDVVDVPAVDVGDEGGWWAANTEGGMMGVAAHPGYPDPPLVYAFYTYESGDGPQNKLVYYDVSADDPAASATVLLEEIPGNSYHDGSRVTFGPANYLWVTTGDAGDPALSRDRTSLAGKVLRMNPDGSAPDDNPDVGGDPRIYSYAHRNPQGLTFLPDATPVENEHGPSPGRDEVNVLRAGGDYGWGPEDERGRDGETYPGTDYDRPVVNTGPGATWAPSGSVFVTGDGVPSWRNRLVVGGLASTRINIVTIYPTDGESASAENGGKRFDADWMSDEYSAVHHTVLDGELGRIRHVEQGPDGALYALTGNRDGRAAEFPVAGDDRLVRITPA